MHAWVCVLIILLVAQRGERLSSDDSGSHLMAHVLTRNTLMMEGLVISVILSGQHLTWEESRRLRNLALSAVMSCYVSLSYQFSYKLQKFCSVCNVQGNILMAAQHRISLFLTYCNLKQTHHKITYGLVFTMQTYKGLILQFVGDGTSSQRVGLSPLKELNEM